MNKRSVFLALSCITIIMALLYWFAAPTMSDDVVYHFLFQKQELGDNYWQRPLERIQDLGDVIRSQVIHYEYVNGRSVIHFIAQVMLNLVPESVMKTLNIFMFLALIGSVAGYVSADKRFYCVNCTMTFGLLFLVISGFGSGFIWALGAFNYTWSLTITMLWLWMIRRLGHKKADWQLAILIPLSMLAGWTHEAITLPLSISFAAYLLMNSKKHGLQRATTYCMIAYGCGALMIIVSPALWTRTGLEGITLTQRLFYGCVNLAFGCRISWMLVLTLTIIFFRSRERCRQVIIEHRYMVLAWLAALGIVFSCGTTLERVPICADFLAMLIMLHIWQGERLLRHQKQIVALIISLSVAVAIPAVKLSYDNYSNYRYHVSQLRQKNSTLIKVRQLPKDKLSAIAKRYVTPTVEYGYYSVYMAFDEHDLNTKAVARLYGKERVVLLPEDVVDKMLNDRTAYIHHATDAHGDLIIQLLGSKQTVSHVSFVLGEEHIQHFYQRLFSYPDNKLNLDDFKYEVLNIHNRRYLVMTMPPKNIASGIEHINIE